jgi:NADPH2:quinone reductase
VLAVVSTPEKAAVARAAGAHETLPVEGFREQALALTGGRGVDVVVDPVGGDRFDDSLAALAVGGRLLVLGFTGRSIPAFPVDRLLPRSTEVLGVASAEFWRGDPGLPARDWAELLPLVAAGRLDPPVGAVLPLERAADALTLVDERRALGRVVLEVRAEVSPPGP